MEKSLFVLEKRSCTRGRRVSVLRKPFQQLLNSLSASANSLSVSANSLSGSANSLSGSANSFSGSANSLSVSANSFCVSANSFCVVPKPFQQLLNPVHELWNSVCGPLKSLRFCRQCPTVCTIQQPLPVLRSLTPSFRICA